MPEKDNSERKARVIRTPAEIAQSAVEKATERVERSAKRLKKAEDELTAAKAEAQRAESFLSYARSNPDLSSADLGDVAAQITHNDGAPTEV